MSNRDKVKSFLHRRLCFKAEASNKKHLHLLGESSTRLPASWSCSESPRYMLIWQNDGFLSVIHTDCFSWLDVLVRVSTAELNTRTKIHVGRERFISLPHHCSSSKEVRTGTQTRQEPGGRSWCRQRPWKGTLYWLAPHGLLSLFSYGTQDQLPTGGTIHSELSPSTSLINQEKAQRSCPQANLIEAFFSTEIASFKWL